jgi:hypothetical protein
VEDLRAFKLVFLKYVLLTLDLSNRKMSAVVSTVAELLTSTIIRTVGSVVAMFCGCGGRIMTGSIPVDFGTNI